MQAQPLSRTWSGLVRALRNRGEHALPPRWTTLLVDQPGNCTTRSISSGPLYRRPRDVGVRMLLIARTPKGVRGQKYTALSQQPIETQYGELN